MEAAAKTIQSLSQRILPEHPHHLSFSPDWRYRHYPADDRRRTEEWHHPRMQYLTLVSQADRGVLLTRSDYDMREEPPKPVPRDVAALATKTGEKKKLSFKDYQNKKSVGALSTSPPEPSPQHKKESERVVNPSTSGPPAAQSSSGHTNHGARSSTSTDTRRSDAPRSREADQSHDGKQSQAQSHPPRPAKPAVDMRLPPKPPPKSSLPPRPPSPENRKRFADHNDDGRPPKRSRPEPGRHTDDPPPSHRRDDDFRRRDRDLPPPRDTISNRDGRPSSSSSLPNGRNILKGPSSSNRNASPAPRHRDDTVNGARPPASTGSRQTPTKADASKSFVPPLLSPLRLSFEKQEQGDSSRKERDMKKKREEVSEPPKQPKPKKLDPPSSTKKPRSPPRLPALLSPTLPPEIEAELQRAKKTPPKAPESRPKEDGRSQPTARKGIAKDGTEETREAKATSKQRFVVTMRIPKRLRPALRKYLNLSPKKEGEHHESTTESPQLPQARKRPIASAETSNSDSIAVKRPRASDISSSARLPAPSTPSKKGSITMSRVSSTNSMANTPGELRNTTPSAVGSIDRASNGLDPSRSDKGDIAALREREAHLSKIGRQLKHRADLVLKTRQANGNGPATEPFPKVRHVLAVESIIAFVAGFHAQNRHRTLSNKTSEPSSWESLFPLIDFHQKEMNRFDKDHFRPLITLLLALQSVSIDELIKCYFTYENPGTHINVETLVKLNRNRTRIWSSVGEANALISDPGLRTDNIMVWSSVDDVVDIGLRVLRRWCSREDIDWTPEIDHR